MDLRVIAHAPFGKSVADPDRVGPFPEASLGPTMRVEVFSHPERQVESESKTSAFPAGRKEKGSAIDVCSIVEGAYPYVSGGVSAWVHGLIRRQPDLRFGVVAILPEPPAPVAKYGALPNL